MGFRSHIHGSIKLDPSEFVDRKVLRFMGDGAAYAYIAMQQAIEDSGLEKDQVSNDKTGLIIGSGGPSTSNMMTAFDLARNKGPKRVGPYMVPRAPIRSVQAPRFRPRLPKNCFFFEAPAEPCEAAEA